jgi:hypothetical protein
VNPTSEPIRTRYAKARSEVPDTAPRSGCCAIPIGRRITPPASISKVVATKASRGSGIRDERYEPVAQATAETPVSAMPHHVAPPSGRKRIATPTKPTSTPTIASRGGRSPPARRSSTTSSGTEAMMSDATPVGTVRSETKSRPLAPGRRRPISAAHASSRRVIRRARRPCRQATIAAMRAPARMNRAETALNAGMVSPATLIPRYVEPQIT